TLTINYDVTDGVSTVSNSATIVVEGRNDTPTITVIDVGTSNEDAAVVSIDLLSTASDVDGDNLDTASVSVSSSNSGRIVAFTIDNLTGAFGLNPAQFNDLAIGQSETLTISYDVTDGTATVSNTATLVVEGRNDAPVVTVLDAGTTNEDAAIVSIDLLSTASDVDGNHLDTSSVAVISSNAGRTIAFTIDNLTGTLGLDPDQFNDLAIGQSETLTVSYNVTDGTKIISNTATLIVEGRNDTPVVTVLDAGTTHEDAAIVSIDLLSTASDVDGNDLDTASVAIISSNAGRVVAFTIDNLSGAFGIDPAQFDDLALGQSETLTISYNITDGTETVSNTATIVVEGRNDAPVVTVLDAGTTNEDAAIVSIDLLSTASDVDGDDLDTSSVAIISSNAGRVVAFTIDNLTGTLGLDPDQFNDLAIGQSETLTVSYNVTDGTEIIANTATLVVEGRNEGLNGTSGNDVIVGLGTDDVLYGGAGNDTLDGGAGYDAYYAGTGNDTILIDDADFDASGNIILQGEEGIDTVTHSGSKSISISLQDHTIENITAGSGNDFIYGSSGDNIISAGAGNDLAQGFGGTDIIHGNAGNDWLYGFEGNDSLFGDGGDDGLYGGIGNDQLDGGAGADQISGEQGDDTLIASEGADTYNFDLGDGHDTYLGSANVNIAGTDTFNFEGAISQNLLWFSRNGSNLDVSVIGSTEGITLQNWYSGTTGDGLSAHIKDFKAGSSTLGFANVNGLVNAMAGFTPEDGSGNGGITATTLPPSVQMAVSAAWS
ncbi:MAG: cadherin-like domain-containing protein, partial [Cohaesibacteraceae bacterium]|nr:cadherin-like domain-containing protein [Cohaesibacteraceae bacterium]